jgi:hypothetical protein
MTAYVYVSCVILQWFTGFIEWGISFSSLLHNEAYAQEDRSRIPIKWPQRIPGQGVTVRINNALDPSYHSFFTTSIQNWENATQFGVPDSIRFDVSTIGPSSSACEDGIFGEIVVCNADYGQTKWVGIELSVTDGGNMLKSIVKINDYYLSRVPAVYKQYTLCHEIGHSIGLEHQDENFYNKGTQSCMDYTAYVQDSTQPNKIDYGKLTQLYGKLPTPPIPIPVPKDKPPMLPLGLDSTHLILASAPTKVVSLSKPVTSTASKPVKSAFQPVNSTIKLIKSTTKPVKATNQPVKLTIKPKTLTRTRSPVSQKPSLRPSAKPSSSLSPLKKPSVSPSASPSVRPTPLPCCSYNNKSCGMAGFCDSSKYVCQVQCAGIWLDGKTRQEREQSNCKGLREMQCGASYECCGNSICQLNPYQGYAVCVPGPPTTSPSIRPSSNPTKSMIPSSKPSSKPKKPTSAPIEPKRITPKPMSSSLQQQQHQSIIDPMHCYCPQTCSRDVLSTYADQFQTCGYYIDYQMKQFAMSELYACLLISEAYSNCGSGSSCNPYSCPGSELHRRVLLSDDSPATTATEIQQESSTSTAAAMSVHKHQQTRRVTLQQLNIKTIERDLGCDREVLGELIQASSDSLRYSLTKDGGTTIVTEVTFSFIADDLFTYLERAQAIMVDFP